MVQTQEARSSQKGCRSRRKDDVDSVHHSRSTDVVIHQDRRPDTAASPTIFNRQPRRIASALTHTLTPQTRAHLCPAQSCRTSRSTNVSTAAVPRRPHRRPQPSTPATHLIAFYIAASLRSDDDGRPACDATLASGATANLRPIDMHADF